MTEARIEIRRADADDAPTIARLLRDFNLEYDEPSPDPETLTGYVRALLAAGEITVFLANGAEGLSLFRLRPALWTEGKEAYLQELYVIPSRRGNGIGRALLEATMDASRQAGAVGIDLNTGETDTAARGLYESAGFTNLEGPGGPQMLFYEREL